MNISGAARSYMAKYFNEEDFLIHVSKTIERQLQEWDNSYKVMIMKLENYLWTARNVDNDYELLLSEHEINVLQKKDPYALDREIWNELQKQGLMILNGYGNYLDQIF
ncbi:hypothetical protein J27TS8_17830 [Robertmurraya siralis]|uniref:Uncharacterized protein n=1 Tax=Robertmurraya siralis TaxID=77777 RepID=A0A920BT60_9BACI|nr:hypothetical protein [Robertmurraya siralis]PAE18444.1 hypothetical protein CHH80_21655 [Bacillus sp. 7504-2]GIN61790.1 hypothetical protein J27TS8_17830 [Robertmurraya siralis]